MSSRLTILALQAGLSRHDARDDEMGRNFDALLPVFAESELCWPDRRLVNEGHGIASWGVRWEWVSLWGGPRAL